MPHYYQYDDMMPEPTAADGISNGLFLLGFVCLIFWAVWAVFGDLV